jgi:ABC-2 type transport system permease protein
MITRIRTMIDKEWAEVFKNRLVLFTVIFLPLLMTLLPLGILYGMHASGAAGSATDIPPQFFQVCGSASPEDCAQIFIVNEFMILFMIMPLAIPVAIAAYSVVGEKTTRSLEPLLATPITTSELLAGKSLAAVIPGILATWVCFFIFVLATPLVGVSSSVQAYMLTGTWLLAVLLVGPLAAVMAANFALIVSSRVNDPRAAEQISMVIILPLLLVLFSQIAGVLILNRSLMLLVALGVLILDVALINLGARLFQRETILTKWK